jgi:hypothetical protein
MGWLRPPPWAGWGWLGHPPMALGGGSATPKAKSKIKKKKKKDLALGVAGPPPRATVWPRGGCSATSWGRLGVDEATLMALGGGSPIFLEIMGLALRGGRSTPKCDATPMALGCGSATHKGQTHFFQIMGLALAPPIHPQGQNHFFYLFYLALGVADAPSTSPWGWHRPPPTGPCGGRPPPVAKMGWPATLLFVYLFLIFYYLLFIYF